MKKLPQSHLSERRHNTILLFYLLGFFRSWELVKKQEYRISVKDAMPANLGIWHRRSRFKKSWAIQVCSIAAHLHVSLKYTPFSIKVCHSSAFQTILVRSAFIKINNKSGSILTNLNNTINANKTACNKKPHTYSNINKVY